MPTDRGVWLNVVGRAIWSTARASVCNVANIGSEMTNCRRCSKDVARTEIRSARAKFLYVAETSGTTARRPVGEILINAHASRADIPGCRAEIWRVRCEATMTVRLRCPEILIDVGVAIDARIVRT